MGDGDKLKLKTPPQDYDMIDNDEELSLYKPLRDALITCRESVFKAYNLADKKALRNQKYHRILTILAAVFGTIAILFAIMQLSGFFPTPWPMWVEVMAAIIALFAVILGLVQARQKQWLLQRHKAERYRLLKFRSLIAPDLWSSNTAKIEGWKNQIKKEVEKVRELTHKSLHKYIEEYEVFEEPAGISDCVIDDNARDALVAYYSDKRLNVQMQYFNKRARSYEGIDKYTKNMPPMFFFLSVLSVLGHFVIDIFFKNGHDLHSVSVFLIVLAASLPLLGAGIRTLRSANEFARSASLFRAKHTALKRLDDRLQKETSCEAVLHTLWHCEQFLEAEHCEWLRLMIVVEWFG